MNDEEKILNIVYQTFETQKDIKILSIYPRTDFNQDYIEGVYVLPLHQSLSFKELPLLDMSTNFNNYLILMDELGQILQGAYRYGDLNAYLKLTHPSDIKISNNIFNTLVDKCKNNPPLFLLKHRLIEWIELTDDVTNIRTKSFINFCKKYNTIDDIDFDDNLENADSAYILSQFNDVKQQLQSKKYKKVSELTIHEIDKLYIQLQINLYMTDNK